MEEVESPESWCWNGEPNGGGQAVIFDIDGVLSDAAGRQHYITEGARDWHAFFEACADDPLIEEVARLLDLLADDLQIVLLTGRPVRVQEQTLEWLQRYKLRWDLLVMRDYGDYTAAREFKRATVRQLRRWGFNLCLAFEDDHRNRDMFEHEGVPCIYIHSGYYD